jgi:general secretion pathway protein F
MTHTFRIRYLRLGDDVVRDEQMTAPDAASLRARLHSQGQTVLSVAEISGAWTFQSGLWAAFSKLRSRSPKRHPFALFCREVRTLIQAGMTVVEAMETLSARERLEGRHDSLSAIVLAHLQQGLSLSAALSDLPNTPMVLIAAVRAGERTSNLIEALDDYLRFDTLVAQLRKKIVSAAIYPALVTAVGLAISLFLLLVVMPKFAAVYANLRGVANGSAALTIQISQFIGSNRAAVLAVLALIVLMSTWWIKSGLAKAHLTRGARRVPWIYQRIEDFQLAMMYQALALLLKGGYPMTEAMAVAGQSALSPELKAAVTQARTHIETGGSVSQALSQVRLCDEVGRRLMAAAERNGDFYRAAEVVSRLHGERFEVFVERVTRIVEPLLLLAVALGVGGIVLLMYAPVFDMATQLR